MPRAHRVDSCDCEARRVSLARRRAHRYVPRYSARCTPLAATAYSGLGDGDELDVEPGKLRAQLVGEPHRAEHLGRDVPGRDQRDLELLREIARALGELAGQEQIAARRARRPRADRSPRPSTRRPCARRRGRTGTRTAALAATRRRRSARSPRRATAAAATPPASPSAMPRTSPNASRVGAERERVGEPDVVAEPRVLVERQVIRGERDVVAEQELAAGARAGRRSCVRPAAPHEAVVDDDQIGALLDRARRSARPTPTRR